MSRMIARVNGVRIVPLPALTCLPELAFVFDDIELEDFLSPPLYMPCIRDSPFQRLEDGERWSDLPFGFLYRPSWCWLDQLRSLDFDIPLKVRGALPLFTRP